MKITFELSTGKKIELTRDEYEEIITQIANRISINTHPKHVFSTQQTFYPPIVVDYSKGTGDIIPNPYVVTC